MMEINFKTVKKKPIKVKAIMINSELVWNIYKKNIINENLEVRKEKGRMILFVKTIEGEMRCKLYDYLICGINGELYCCDCEIFHKTYEVVE